MEFFLLDLSEYEIVKAIDDDHDQVVEGAYIVQHKETKKYYFAEVFKTECRKKKHIFADLLKYIKAKHQAILGITGLSFSDFKGDFKTTILTPYMTNGSLRDIIDKECNKIQVNNWTSTKKLICIIGIALGLAYLHHIGITHRNLKPENILFDDNFYPKIKSFGYSRIFETSELNPTNKSDQTKSEIKESKKKEKEYYEKEDIHSFGLILKEFYKNIYQDQKVEFLNDDAPSSEISSIWKTTLNKLIADCLSTKTEDRPSITLVIKELIKFQNSFPEEVDKIEVEKYFCFYKGEVAYKEKDFLTAAKYYKRAIEIGNTDAMNRYGKMFTKGEGLEMNSQEALKYYKHAVELGNTKAMCKYALMLEKGEGIEENQEEALKYIKHAAELGNINAMNSYAYLLSLGENIEKDTEGAIKYYKQAIELGSPDAMFNYAFLLEEGEEIEKNIEKAVKYYKKSIKLGSTISMNSYASMLREGEDIEQDVEKAVKYYQKAIELGDGEAMNSYAFMLKEGEEIEQDLKQAVIYFKRGIEIGNPDAIFNYALMLREGNGIEKNPEEAVKYFKQGIELWDFYAMSDYIMMLKEGNGIKKDPKKAKSFNRLFTKLCQV